MLLHQLVDYRPTAGPAGDTPGRPYSRVRAVRWDLALDGQGRCRGLIDLADPGDKSARFGRPTYLPHAARTVGIAPGLGADDLQYVLGWVDEKSKPERVAAAHAAFVALARRWAALAPEDPAATAVVAFYDNDGPNSVAKDAIVKWSSKDIVAISVAGRPVTDSDSLWRLWSRVVEERKSGTVGAARRGLCLVCGTVSTLLNRMPQALPKPLVPRADQEVALISANKPIHTYDFREGLGTAPICVDCGQAAVANLNTILSNREHSFSYERQRTRLAWWVTHGGDANTIALLDKAPDVIDAYLTSIDRARKPRALQQHELCSLTVSGNVARLVVHDWIVQPLATAEERILRWFDDHQVTHRWRDGTAKFPIWLLVLCAGQWVPNTAGQGRYIEFKDKAADRPDDLGQLLVHSALTGARLPPYVLAHVVRRIRTDSHLDEARAALLRVALTRYPTRTQEMPMPGLDPNCTDPAYVSGRIFATLEATQRAAFPRDDQPNTTFYDRYFAGAISNPRIATIQGSQLRAAWSRKIRTSAEQERTPAAREKRRAVAGALDRRFIDLLDLLDATPLPARISTEQQSMFILGYHHQRAHDLAQARAGRAPEIVADGAGNADSEPQTSAV